MGTSNPDVDVTETQKWLRLKYENLATPAEKVILNNLEVIAAQNRTIIRDQEVLCSLLQRYTPCSTIIPFELLTCHLVSCL